MQPSVEKKKEGHHLFFSIPFVREPRVEKSEGAHFSFGKERELQREIKRARVKGLL